MALMRLLPDDIRVNQNNHEGFITIHPGEFNLLLKPL